MVFDRMKVTAAAALLALGLVGAALHFWSAACLTWNGVKFALESRFPTGSHSWPFTIRKQR